MPTTDTVLSMRRALELASHRQSAECDGADCEVCNDLRVTSGLERSLRQRHSLERKLLTPQSGTVPSQVRAIRRLGRRP